MVDDLDRKLIMELQFDGRQTNNDLGRKLYVNEGTVRKRLKKLQNDQIIKVVAVPNVGELGYNFVSIVAIQVDMAYLNEVAKALATKHSICQIIFVTGRYDLIIMTANRSTEEFSKFMREELSVIPHIIRTETFVVLSIAKGSVGLTDTTQLIADISISSSKKSEFLD